MPQGIAIAGWWLMSNGPVLDVMSKARATMSSRDAPGPGRAVALIGVVGISSRSWRSSSAS